MNRPGRGEHDLGADTVGEELALRILHDDRTQAEPLSRGDGGSVERYGAAVRLEASDHAGESGLARPVGTAHCRDASGWDMRGVDGQHRAPLEGAPHIHESKAIGPGPLRHPGRCG